MQCIPDLLDRGNLIYIATANTQSRLALQHLCHNLIDLLACYFVDVFTILVEGNFAPCHIVTRELFQPVFLSLHRRKNIHFCYIFSSPKFRFADWIT